MGLFDKLLRRNTQEDAKQVAIVQQPSALFKPTEIEAAIAERAQKIQLG